MAVAVTTKPGHALTISRLRDFAPLFASLLHTVTHDDGSRSTWGSGEILRPWAA